MKVLCRVVALAVLISLAGTAYAELQNVQIDGEIRIRGRMWNDGWAGTFFDPYPAGWFGKRPLGPFGISSLYGWDSKIDDRAQIEQRTDLGIRADFTDDVSAYIEFHNYAVWGEDFRSEYVTGVDSRADSSDDVQVFQAYIEARNLWGTPLRLRVGRQEIVMGNAWLIGSSIAPTIGLSYDALRLTYDADLYDIDFFYAKLNENFGNFNDDDVDLYGLYAECSAWEPATFALFYYLVRDARDIDDSPGSDPLTNALEKIIGVNQYDNTYLHTVGLRVDGETGNFDYDATLAYQWGDFDALGSQFKLFPAGVYGDDGLDTGLWAFDGEVGYRIECKYPSRVYLGGAYFDAEDNRDLSFWNAINPFYTPQASASFNRLFSGHWYTASTDILGGASAQSNFYQVRTGVKTQWTDSVSTVLKAAYFWVTEPFDMPLRYTFGPVVLPVGAVFPWLTEEQDDELGLVLTAVLKYQYSEDLWISFGWEHMFTEDGMTDGNYIFRNGTLFSGGRDDDDCDYIWFDTQIKF